MLPIYRKIKNQKEIFSKAEINTTDFKEIKKKLRKFFKATIHIGVDAATIFNANDLLNQAVKEKS